MQLKKFLIHLQPILLNNCCYSNSSNAHVGAFLLMASCETNHLEHDLASCITIPTQPYHVTVTRPN